jgi:putative PIG3 family NAD(P)H quinone oxidoreductase
MEPLPTTMRAIEIAEFGGPEGLRLVERPVPRPASGEVLVRVAAAGVNRPDILQRLGHYPPPPGASDIPGLEIAGTVVSVEPNAAFTEGDRVCALVAGGGYAEYCAVPIEQCLPVPPGLSDEESSALPETYFTVWTNLFERGRLSAHETVLVHGGSSGIGTTAIQLARAFGSRVFATAGSAEKCQACGRLGAARAINYRSEDFVAVVGEETHTRGVDVILDIVGGDYLPRNLEALAPDGRLVQIGLLGGAKATVNLRQILQKRLTVTGSTLRARPAAEKGRIARELAQHVWPLLARREVAPLIHAIYPLRAAAEAHARLERGDVIGKVVLRVAAGTE